MRVVVVRTLARWPASALALAAAIAFVVAPLTRGQVGQGGQVGQNNPGAQVQEDVGNGQAIAPAEFATPLDPAKWGIGKVVADLTFTDLDGKTGRLSDFAAKPALVIVVRSVGCPVSKRYARRTAEIEKQYAAKGVSFLYVNTSKQDSLDDCRAECKEYGFTGCYLQDLSERFGWHLQVASTTDVFVLDPERRLRYRGAIDDQIGRGMVTKPAPTQKYLENALDAVLKGERVEVAAMTAPGCALDFTIEPPAESNADQTAGSSTETTAAPPTWHGRIEAIAQERCQRCHRKGGAADFELKSADDFSGASKMVRQVVVAGIMPPWFASPESGPFLHDTRLLPEEKRDLLAWMQAGCPVGDSKDAPPPQTFNDGWAFEPDLIVESPRTYDIPEAGVVDYINIAADTKLDHDVWVQAIQIRCEHPEICHHILAHATYRKERYQEFIDSYLPGRGATFFPDDQALLLRKGVAITFNFHYTPNGTKVKERTKIGFKFAKQPPKYRVSGRIVRPREDKIDIPPHCDDFKIVSEWKFPFPAMIRRIIPHMHLRGKAFTSELIEPDGTTIHPLDLPTWNPNWQFAYEFEHPIAVKKGTTIRLVTYFDNSDKNPFNTDPGKRVVGGPQIWNEMAGAFVEWYRPADAPDPMWHGAEGDDEGDGAAERSGGGGSPRRRRPGGRNGSGDGSGKTGEDDDNDDHGDGGADNGGG